MSSVSFSFRFRFVGKQSKAFKSSIASHAESKKCFTAVGCNRAGQSRELSLEGDSKEQVAAWLFGQSSNTTQPRHAHHTQQSTGPIEDGWMQLRSKRCCRWLILSFCSLLCVLAVRVGINAILTHKGGRKVMTAEDSEKEEARKKAAAAARAAEVAAAKAAQEAEHRALEEQQRLALEAQKQAQAAAERAMAAAAAEAVRNAAEQAAQSAAEKAAAEKRAADAVAAAEAATAAAVKAKEAAEAAAAASAAAAAERIAAAEAAAAESAAAAAAASASPVSPAVVRVRRRADGSVITGGLADELSELSLHESSPASSPMTSPSSPGSAAEEETASTWLASLGDAYPGEYSKLFKDNGVDLHFLVGLSPEELQEMGVKNGLHLKKMTIAIEKLRESGKYNSAPKVLATQKAVVAEPEPVVAASTAAAASASAPASAAAAAAAPAIPESPIGQFLYKLGPAFLVYLKTFEDNGVNLTFLLTLNDDDLEELGVSKLHRKKMVQEIKETRAQSKEHLAAPSSSSASASASGPSHARTPSSGGGYLARAAAAKSGSSSAAPVSASSNGVGTMDDIVAAIKEAKAKKEASGASAAPQPPADDIDLAGTSIAAIAARMAAQREARAKAAQA